MVFAAVSARGAHGRDDRLVPDRRDHRPLCGQRRRRSGAGGPLTAATPEWVTRRDGGVVVAVKAVPRSRQTAAVGVQDGAVRIHIAAAPHKGASNAALCAYLADCAGVRASAVRLRRGSTGARKLIEIDGPAERIEARLARLAEDIA
ncbi:MAG: DUF167 domain-containing protein [Thermoleophilia bacterium]|nr:DUF167 domain-containing protein [Thermoleophilia bacterium]